MQACCSSLHVHVCHEGPHPLPPRMRMQWAAFTITPACRWATGLTFSLPDSWTQLLVPYFTMGRAQLTDSPSAFVDLSRRALTMTSMSS